MLTASVLAVSEGKQSSFNVLSFLYDASDDVYETSQQQLLAQQNCTHKKEVFLLGASTQQRLSLPFCTL